MNVTLENYLYNLSAIIMNLGNLPFYDFENKLVKELNEINKFKKKNEQIFVIFTGKSGKHDVTDYTAIDTLKGTNIPFIIVDMDKIINEIRTQQKTVYSSCLAWGNHYCLPSIPGHFMLLFIELINQFIDSYMIE